MVARGPVGRWRIGYRAHGGDLEIGFRAHGGDLARSARPEPPEARKGNRQKLQAKS
jgi:hypothetical protein